MENFVVSARKYRPITFDTVVGQHSITSTLKNAIQTNHLAQAFLFCGPRGVGKTTCARILAKTINCINRTHKIEPCDTCESCISFNQGQSLNIYELDAASNNSVDDIRNLIDMVRYAPQVGTTKVYIIDEVHMLSQAAFNAFLKTLEEPPKHAIFILATTEKHKILPTILSRCQVFDFNRITAYDTAKHLAEIAAKEGITAEPDALHIIAQKADGALRDALSIFDQVVSFSGNNISYEKVIENLNVLDYDYYFGCVNAMLKNDISSLLLTFNEILQKGFDGHNFMNGLANHFRNLLVCKDEKTLILLDAGKNIKEKYKNQSQQCSPPFLLKSLEISNTCDLNYKMAKNQRLLVEITLMQLASFSNSSTSVTEEKKNTDYIIPPNNGKENKMVSESTLESTPIEPQNPIRPKEAETLVQPLSSMPTKPVLTSNFSLKNRTKQTEKKETKPLLIENDNEQAFTFEAFMECWQQIANAYRLKNNISLYSTFTVRKPILHENHLVEILLDNKAQEEELNAEKIEILNALRKSLNNYKIQLSTTVNKNEKIRKAYTSSDKFKEMAIENPLLNTLKEQLDLDFNVNTFN
ncbi:MAG: DNA polymerase III subunit gamma/tau [Bacteroidetes bacterium]|nr:DNA polymerase III subunit gamma/tau [Bacteroidota bacterium]MCL4817324.1 DNA polymerase III subunit gamma/tau [Flavobacteriales bacterium]WKZ74165.1 MAG: DNA polymerase III subunit gamma/tau [Vicingaceae bacterium]NOG95922.1 DNA polymerase III subunit gamma/tau [Bacteroidota bacterium]CAG0974587.1 DNA polymerase III subunit gamma/tau [Flavobacteriales bacterium]